MEHQLTIYNTLNRKKELFVPLHAPHVGMYVCGPTVYGDAHLGHARPSITFDVLFRYLTHLGYKVRYVRNITDVGHLEHDADDGEDKIAKKARLEELEPMDLAYDGFHDFIEFRVRGNLKKDKEKMIKKIADEIIRQEKKEEVIAYISESWS